MNEAVSINDCYRQTDGHRGLSPTGRSDRRPKLVVYGN